MAGVSTEGGRVEAPDSARDSSFADVFAQHYLPALRLAALLEGDPTRAEDAVCDVGEGFWSISTVPGVGAFAATGPADQNAGILFSADGLHWEQRARG